MTSCDQEFFGYKIKKIKKFPVAVNRISGQESHDYINYNNNRRCDLLRPSIFYFLK